MFLNDFNGLNSTTRLQENFGGIKEWLLKLKEKLGTETDETREMFDTYVRYTQGQATEAEMSAANDQFKDLLRGLGMGALAAMPGSMITLPVVFKLAKKFNIEIMPSAFRAPQDNNPENEARLHTQYKRNRFKSLDQHRQEEEYILRQAMRGINNEAANAAQQAAIAIAKKKEQGVTENTSEIKKKISKYEELALAANRAGNDAKCKQYQQKIQSLKQQMSQGVAEGLDSEKKQRLEDLIDQYRDATDPEAYYGLNDEYPDAEEVIAQIRQEFGNRTADSVEQGPSMHYPRPGHSRGYDPMQYKSSPRITKSGVLNKQDVGSMKRDIKQRLKQGVAEGTTGAKPGWMLKQDPALAKKVKDSKRGHEELKKWAGKPVPKKDKEVDEGAGSMTVGMKSNHSAFKESLEEAIERAALTMAEDGYEFTESLRTENPCWKGYHPVGTKKKNGRTVPNCVPQANEDGPKGYDSDGNPLGGGYDEYYGPAKWTVTIDGKSWKSFDDEKEAYRAAASIERKYGKKTRVYKDS